MHEDRWLGLAIVGLGGFWLLRNIGVLPPLNWSIIWPLLLVGLGIWFLADNAKEDEKSEVIINGQRVYTSGSGGSALAKLLAGIVVVFTLGIVALILFGLAALFLVLFIPILPLLLFFRLGMGFLRLLLSFSIMGAPVLLILIILALLF